VWGYSYIRTFYNWVRSSPTESASMEGGIATSYYVIRALCQFYREAGVPLDPGLIRSIGAFFKARTNADGSIGIITVGDRGDERVMAHMRHTCFGYLIERELAELNRLDPELQGCHERTVGYLLKDVPHQVLVEAWMNESWPVGGIASYIAARDDLYASFPSRWGRSAYRNWPEVKRRLVSGLTRLRSSHIANLTMNQGRLASHSGEYFPYWHPIKSQPVLRMHSSLGCVSLLRRSVGSDGDLDERLEGIIRELTSEIFAGGEPAPRFMEGGRPSIAAASAVLELSLCSESDDSSVSDLVNNVISFIESKWDAPEVYHDYWSEFTAPLLGADAVLTSVDIGAVLRRATRVLDGVGEHDSVDDETEKELRSKIERLIPVALGKV